MTVDNFNWFLHIMLFLHTGKVIKRQKEKKEKVEDDSDEEDNSDMEE